MNLHKVHAPRDRAARGEDQFANVGDECFGQLHIDPRIPASTSALSASNAVQPASLRRASMMRKACSNINGSRQESGVYARPSAGLAIIADDACVTIGIGAGPGHRLA